MYRWVMTQCRGRGSPQAPAREVVHSSKTLVMKRTHHMMTKQLNMESQNPQTRTEPRTLPQMRNRHLIMGQTTGVGPMRDPRGNATMQGFNIRWTGNTDNKVIDMT